MLPHGLCWDATMASELVRLVGLWISGVPSSPSTIRTRIRRRRRLEIEPPYSLALDCHARRLYFLWICGCMLPCSCPQRSRTQFDHDPTEYANSSPKAASLLEYLLYLARFRANTRKVLMIPVSVSPPRVAYGRLGAPCICRSQRLPVCPRAARRDCRESR
ncbi:hypothetical protein BDV95DRAFT_5197 [Massariosphaeria phaeospora]|uniref:Uncharacterized protein n=1 Tax=Massariosphaeria phaeospora TaxID=100035 RepID=A0A7C8IJ76_9PLEO|nr:hypothetical protein BDV95DRAFT_5197 [Massariosphaeria phaeospora]